MLLLLQPSEIILIAIVVLLLFGGTKIPELMRGLGKGMRYFREGMKGIDSSESDQSTEKNDAKGDDTKA
ncbi:MAG: twin-arginine translocase TatA/TatE family subunit [Paludibacteraceae bacterium]|nr:twin-arginine translocase TatA/TatE family subunit [Paludibacteraceae bacterium]